MLNEQLLILITTPIYIVVIAAEIILSNLHLKKYYTLKGTLLNVYLCVLNGGIDLLFRAVYLVILITVYQFHFISFSFNPFLYWFLLFIAEDIAFYFEHRVDHFCRIFWAIHVTHHSSEEFNLTTGFRSSVLQPLYRFIYFIPLVLLGFKPLDIVFMYSLTQIYGILVHTQYISKMPSWFEAVFVSPAHHRVHHASNVRYLDKNLGMVLIIWDKIFGTFQKEVKEDPVRYGLTKPLSHPYHLTNIIFHEWKDISRDMRKKIPFWLKIKYLIMPPGWSHDDSTKTAKQLRRELLQKEIKHSSGKTFALKILKFK
ncbi:MAG: sterol desaturase family protein [Bacteroidota bacterium]|nr:sterol desaturase family protein [Bacteroidota bacterium]